MSNEQEDPKAMIARMEREMNEPKKIAGTAGGQSVSAVDSGVNENVTSQFPGSTVQVGGTKRGENPVIPDEEGGEINKASGQQTKANQFEGTGGPEDKVKLAERDRPGDDDVTGNVKGQTRQ